jgi:hypothetical protein
MWRRTERANLEKKPSIRLFGREGELEAASRSSGEPLGGLSGDARRMIVEDQFDRRSRRIGAIEKLEKFGELATAVAVSDEGVDLAPPIERKCPRLRSAASEPSG